MTPCNRRVSGRVEDRRMDPTPTLESLGTVVTVWAHPDDETYLAGGLMAALVANAQRVVCITATAGEQGTSDAHPDPRALAPLRRQELAAALAALGVREHVLLGLPDGGCAALGDDAPIGRLQRAIERFRADTVVTFGPDGATGHADHRAVSRWVDLAVPSRSVRVLHAVTTRAEYELTADVHDALGLELDPGCIVEEHEVTFGLRLDATLLARKLDALRAHTSQTSGVFDALGSTRVGEWVGVESFVER
jgi:LmbE family N-acetylglucosaminyl deacetylase